MELLSSGQIYLADHRGFLEDAISRRSCSFNYESYFNEHREPFGNLKTLNDEILAAAQSISINIDSFCYLMIIPVTGKANCTINNNILNTVDVGEVFVRYAIPGDVLKLTNVYQEDWINYIFVQFKADASLPVNNQQKFDFDLEVNPNRLVSVVNCELNILPFTIHIGRFDGRKEALYQLKNDAGLFYAFIIGGAFELQGRLMHQRDGLALWDVKEVDLEALSNNAVILIIEMP